MSQSNRHYQVNNQLSAEIHEAITVAIVASVQAPQYRKDLRFSVDMAAGKQESLWSQVVAHWANLRDVNGNKKLSICTFDARGIGKSSSPSKLRQYSTHLMASDAIALLEHIGWVQTHIVGLSLGGRAKRLCCKLLGSALW